MWKICVTSIMDGSLPILAALHGASPDESNSSPIVRSVGFAAQDEQVANRRDKAAAGIRITHSLSMVSDMN